MNDIIDKAIRQSGIDLDENPAYKYKLTKASIKKNRWCCLWT